MTTDHILFSAFSQLFEILYFSPAICLPSILFIIEIYIYPRLDCRRCWNHHLFWILFGNGKCTHHHVHLGCQVCSHTNRKERSAPLTALSRITPSVGNANVARHSRLQPRLFRHNYYIQKFLMPLVKITLSTGLHYSCHIYRVSQKSSKCVTLSHLILEDSKMYFNNQWKQYSQRFLCKSYSIEPFVESY